MRRSDPDGIALIVAGRRNGGVLFTVGLVLTMLKPQIGALLLVAASVLFFFRNSDNLLALTIICVLAFGGLHSYDVTLALGLVPLVTTPLLFVGLLLLFRPGNLANVIPVPQDSWIFQGSIYATFAILILLLAWLSPITALRAGGRGDQGE
ncbi:MAG: hypothetical protein ACU0DB_12540 [Paracoccus sp. (in: a-proteobacteria)]|uniref:hypothetical protein n=1 Tax=unclassified Paracoccus (in: a-proteobacteria) TaxID=2688777 RepID=UPI000C48A531|nr:MULTISPECIES: hypothetical protein [unclassified Paracoccus (in: a-proteobacteria)]MAN55860.1 hypothetical protein [Paracoccus sp. (in: a-proteobacteria)]MBA49863.1 hypothetical protein [Paracoccus sp. (in: a-proteobacteria)]MCS5602705.1 hypothetical protein [Paracoccus sp. (in: a-proteobacteria)]MDB2551089.1 hypothetical protein [Paracoccus sp. (in: a-proteobacteria)]